MGVYKVYKLIEIRRGEKIIKCERRYDNFHEFYKRIKKVYPWCLIPKLTEKNALAKIINMDSNFYLKRKNQLSLFIKYIKQHKKLKETIEFKKFIRDPTFDSEFFKCSESFINEAMFSESLKQTDTIKGTLYGYFNNVSNLFKKEEESEFMENSNEKELHKMEKFYRICLEDIKNMKTKMVNIVFDWLINYIY